MRTVTDICGRCVWATYLKAGLNLGQKTERKHLCMYVYTTSVCIYTVHVCVYIWQHKYIKQNQPGLLSHTRIHFHVDDSTILSYVLWLVCGRVTKERSKPAAEDTSFLAFFVFFNGNR